MKKFIIAMVIVLIIGVVLSIVGIAILGGANGKYFDEVTYTEESFVGEESFNVIKLSFNSARNLKIVEGEEYSVKYTDNSLTDITFSVKDGVLTVSESENYEIWVFNWRRNIKSTDFVITVPSAEKVSVDCTINGAINADLVERATGYGTMKFKTNGAVRFTGKFSAETLSIETNGALKINYEGTADKVILDTNGALEGSVNGNIGELKVETSGALHFDGNNLTCSKFSADVSGSAHIYLNGTGDEMDLDISGSCTVNAEYFTLRKVDADISGSGSLSLNVSESLSVDGSRSLTVKYRGEPNLHIDKDVKVQKLD